MTPSPIRIDIVSDVVCPWCIIGYKQIERALTMIEQPVAVEFWWHPFELNPKMAPQGEDVAAHIARKYGSTPEQSHANRQRLCAIGDDVGFSFDFGDGMRIYNTFAAHKLLAIFGAERGWKAQTTLKLALFKAYFQERRDVSDEAVLVDIADMQGMDRNVTRAWLADDMLAQTVRTQQSYWLENNITAVPAVTIDRRFMVPGAQNAETFAGIIIKSLERRGVA